MQVLAQWSDDVSYPRRTADYVPVNCVQSSKMDVSDPSGGGTKNVHFSENDGSDSASDEAIAGSDHEGADEQTGPVDRH